MNKARIALMLSLALSIGGGAKVLAQANSLNKNESQQRLNAVSLAASFMCFATKGIITEKQSLILLKKNLKEQNMSEKLDYLMTEDGTKASKVIFTYLNPDCKTLSDEDAAIRAVFPFL